MKIISVLIMKYEESNQYKDNSIQYSEPKLDELDDILALECTY